MTAMMELTHEQERLFTLLGDPLPHRLQWAKENTQDWARQRIAVHANAFRVVVDYGRTLEQMVKAGKYDWSNDDITEENFPVMRQFPEYSWEDKGNMSLKVKEFSRVQAPTQELELCLMSLADLDLPTPSSIEKVLKGMKHKGLRPATLPEVLVFGEQFPEVQREDFWIVGLGSVWRNDDGYLLVPVLFSDGRRRDLSLRWYDSGWDDDDRFLGVRKCA